MQDVSIVFIHKKLKTLGDNISLDSAQTSSFSNISDEGHASNAALWHINTNGTCTLNEFSNVYATSSSGINLGASCTLNRFKNVLIRAGSGSALTCAGTKNDIDIRVTAMTGAGDVITMSGTRNTLVAHIEACANASSGILDSGGYNEIHGGVIFNLAAGSGIEITGSYSSVRHMRIDTMGVHGIYVNAGNPKALDNNTIMDCNRLAGTGYGIGYIDTSNHTVGGTCNGNVIFATSGSHTNSIFVTDNTGSPRYDYLNISDNNFKSGGAISVSAGNNIITDNRS